MPRQNRWNQDELENIFEGYLAGQSSGRPTDAFSMADLEEEEDTFDFIDNPGRPQELDFGPGRHEEMYVPELDIPEVPSADRNLLRLLGQAQQ